MSIVLKLFLTMKKAITPMRPAGKCILIQLIKSDLSWIGFFTKLLSRKGPFKCYVTQIGVGVVRFSGKKRGCQIFWKKALRRCNVQRY